MHINKQRKTISTYFIAKSAPFSNKNKAASLFWFIMDWWRSVRPSSLVTLIFAPPASSFRATLNSFNSNAKLRGVCPLEFFTLKFGTTTFVSELDCANAGKYCCHYYINRMKNYELLKVILSKVNIFYVSFNICNF